MYVIGEVSNGWEAFNYMVLLPWIKKQENSDLYELLISNA